MLELHVSVVRGEGFIEYQEPCHTITYKYINPIF